MSIRILLADDHKIVRQGLRNLIEKQPGMEVVAEAEDGRTAVELANELKPDIVIMDISMPGLNGIEATLKILKETKGVKVIGLSMHSDRRFVAEMLKAGASAYLLKDCAFDKLATGIRAVMAGRIYLGPWLADLVVTEYIKLFPEKEFSVFSVLTPREREVLQLISEGMSTREIAVNLKIGLRTVETHRQQIMDRLNLHSVAELTKYAIREGLTFLEE